MAIGAVITGDFVNSTLTSKPQHKKLISEVETILSPYKFEFFRGDSFQVYLKDVDKSLETILKIRLAAQKLPLASSKPLVDVRDWYRKCDTSRKNIKYVT